MNNKINFGSGYKGYSWYGIPEDRSNISYRPTVTPRKVSNWVDKSFTKDIGIHKSLDAIDTDGANISKSINGLHNITKEFLGIAQNRGTEIGKMQPAGSRLPFIGFIFTAFRGDFNDKVKSELTKVEEDWSGIKKHYKSQVEIIQDNFMDSCETLKDVSKKGMPAYREKYKNSAINSQEQIDNHLTDLNKKLINPTDDMMKVFKKTIYEAQQKKQNGRAWRKGLLDLLHTIPIIGTAGAEVGKAAVDVATDVIVDVSHGHFSDLAHDVISDFGKINIHDAINGVNPDLASNFAGDSAFESLNHLVHNGNFDIGFGHTDHVDNVFQGFISSNPEHSISNITDFRNSINWKNTRNALGKSAFVSAFASTAETLEHNIKTGKKFSMKDFSKVFCANTILAPFAMEAKELVEGLNLGDGLGKALKNINTKTSKINPKLKLDPKAIKDTSQFLDEVLPKNAFTAVQDNLSAVSGKVLIGKPLSTPDFEKLFKTMENLLKEANKSALRKL